MSLLCRFRPISFLLLFFVAIGLAGCAVDLGFKQLDTLKRLSDYRTKSQLDAQLWEVRIGNDYEHIAIPVQHEKHMTFYVQDGTEIDFVGWDVTALRNWNYYGKAIEVERSDVVLEHYLLDGRVTELSCTSYESTPLLELRNETLRVANCKGLGADSWQYRNAVVLNDQGVALWMYHHVAPKMPPIELRLRRSNKPGSSEEIDYRLLFE